MRTTEAVLQPSWFRRRAISDAVVSSVHRTGLGGLEGASLSWTWTDPRCRSARIHWRSAGWSCAFCRRFSSVLRSSVEEEEEGGTDTETGFIFPVAAEAERFLFSRRLFNSNELEFPVNPRPLFEVFTAALLLMFNPAAGCAHRFPLRTSIRGGAVACAPPPSPTPVLRATETGVGLFNLLSKADFQEFPSANLALSIFREETVIQPESCSVSAYLRRVKMDTVAVRRLSGAVSPPDIESNARRSVPVGKMSSRACQT